MINRERYGAPQVAAVVMLLCFVGQCAWFISRVGLTQVESNYITAGRTMLRSGAAPGTVASDQYRSPLVPLVAGVPAETASRIASAESAQAAQVDDFYNAVLLDRYRWLLRAPFLFAGVMLGASIWYVARRLYGNAGGYIALGLYSFSPGFVIRSSLVGPEIIAAWGLFGMIFTAIAVSHTLYAPREVVLWNWRRILLLGFCILLAVGAQFSLAVLLLLALAFMWWAVPHRRGAALVILLAAVLVAGIMLSATYAGHFGEFARGLARARWLSFAPEMLGKRAIYSVIGSFFVRDAIATTLLALVALVTYMSWRRTRFFGNTVPLVVALVLIVLGILMSGAAGLTFLFCAIPFLMVFASGVFADLIDTNRASTIIGVVFGILLTQAAISLFWLVQLTRLRR